MLMFCSIRTYADEFARTNCLFDAVEVSFSDYFYPNDVSTETIYYDNGEIKYIRQYSNAAISNDKGNIYYKLFDEDWIYYGSIDKADQDVTGGSCKIFANYAFSETDFCSTPNAEYTDIFSINQVETYGVNILDYKWGNGKTINVAFDFYNKDYLYNSYLCKETLYPATCEDKIIEEVAKFANEWSEYGNIKFKFGVLWSQGDIRITFRNSLGGGNSAIGINSLKGKYNGEPSMTLGLNFNTTQEQLRRTTIHEFGHAIGFYHEHLSPKQPYQWNRSTIYSYYSGPPNNWDINTIDCNVIKPLDISRYKSVFVTNELDPKSIMIYPIQSNFVSQDNLNDYELCPEMGYKGYCVGWNTTLSDLDKWSVSQIYPFDGYTVCTYDISPSNKYVEDFGYFDSIEVTTQTECSWQALSNNDWIILDTNATKKSNGSIYYSVSYNSSNNPRTGTITIAGKTVTVTQSGKAIKPTAPSNLSATALSKSSIKIEWIDNSDNETGFYIEKWNGSSWDYYQIVEANITSFTDIGLQAGTTHNYVVQAYNSLGKSDYTDYVSATTNTGSKIYSYVDANGVRHYTDKLPIYKYVDSKGTIHLTDKPTTEHNYELIYIGSVSLPNS